MADTDTGTREPCPNHPDEGNVAWFSVRIGPRFPGNRERVEQMPSCLPCMREVAEGAYPDPTRYVEVDNPMRAEVRLRRGLDETGGA